MSEIKTIGILTSGGDAPGMNAAIRSVTRSAIFNGLKVKGIYRGFRGLITNEIVDFHTENVSNIIQRGGTILKTARCKEFQTPEGRQLAYDVARSHNIDAIVVIGGDGSLTGARIFANEFNFPMIGLPGTIDNDLFGTDHCPGFASAAKYIATSITEVYQDSHVYDKGQVSIIEIMGRHAGWLAGAASLAAVTGYAADLVYLPEVDFNMDEFLEDVSALWEKNHNVIVAVSEGIHYADGSFVSEAKTSATDGFGHAQLGGLAAMLADVVKEKLGVKVRGIELSLLQRCAAHCASQTDIDESFLAGQTAVNSAVAGETDKMVAFECSREGGYSCTTKLLNLSDVANYEKKVPVEWINERGNNVSQAFIDYALPLIQGETKMPKENGLPRFAKLAKIVAE